MKRNSPSYQEPETAHPNTASYFISAISQHCHFLLLNKKKKQKTPQQKGVPQEKQLAEGVVSPTDHH